MAEMKLFQFTERDLEDQATNVKNLVLHYLAKKDMISKDTEVEMVNNFAIIARPPSFFQRMFRRNKGETLQFILVRQENLEEPDDEEKPPMKLIPLNKPEGEDK